MKITYLLIALSIVTGFALCALYSLWQGDQTPLWGGLLMLTVVPVALYALRDSFGRL